MAGEIVAVLGLVPVCRRHHAQALTLTNVSARQGGAFQRTTGCGRLRIWPGHGRLSRYLPARGRREGSARTKSRSSVVRARAGSVGLRRYARSHGHGHGGPRRTATAVHGARRVRWVLGARCGIKYAPPPTPPNRPLWQQSTTMPRPLKSQNLYSESTRAYVVVELCGNGARGALPLRAGVQT